MSVNIKTESGLEKIAGNYAGSVTKEAIGLGDVTNDKQVKGLSTGTTTGHLVSWGSDGYSVTDTGAKIISTDINVVADKDNVPTAGAVKTAIESATSGMQKCLGTVSSLSGLSEEAKIGNYYRVKTAWKTGDIDVHVSDVLIAEKDNPEQKIDGTNWSLLHNEMDTNTTYTLTQDNEDGHKLTFESSDGTSKNIIIPDNNTEYTAKTNDALQLSGTEFSHRTGSGYNHIPAAGATGNVLRNNGTGSVAWEAVDATPTSGSNKLITSGAVYSGLDDKVTKTSVSSGENSTTSVINVTDAKAQMAMVAKISGKTEKRNLVDINQTWTKQTASNTVTVSGSTVTITGIWYCMIPVPVKPNTNYALRGTIVSATQYGLINVMDSAADKSLVQLSTVGTDTSAGFNSGSNSIVYLGLYGGKSTSGTSVYKNVQINEGALLPYAPFGLLSAPVESVVSRSTKPTWRNGVYNASGVITDASAYISTTMMPIKGGDTIAITVSENPRIGRVYFFDKDNKRIDPEISFDNNSTKTVTAHAGAVSFGVSFSNASSNVRVETAPTMTFKVNNSYFAGGVKTTVLVPSEARNCVGYGLGISDSVCNIADFENGVYTQMCGIVDLGDLTYALAGSEFKSANFVSTYNAKIDRGGLCAIYTGGNTYTEYSALGNKAIHIDNNGGLYIKDNSYSTGDALKAALKGVKFVFELASAKTTPLKDFIRPLPVENGGTLTLVNEHNLDMPSVIKYKKEV